MEHYTILDTLPGAQSVITVANQEAQAEIREYLTARGHDPAEDYFFFC